MREGLAYDLSSSQHKESKRTMGEYVKIATIDEIPPGEAKAVEVSGQRIAVFNIGGTLYAVEDTCTHRGGPLSEGFIENDEVTCPWHGARFRVTTGEALSPPAPRGVRTFAVRLHGDDVEIEL